MADTDADEDEHVPTVAELAKRQLARLEGGRWLILPEGQAEIDGAMRRNGRRRRERNRP